MNFNMQQAMKQVQKMQAEMARVQQELEEKTVEVSVGGGAVALAISGQLEVKSVGSRRKRRRIRRCSRIWYWLR